MAKFVRSCPVVVVTSTGVTVQAGRLEDGTKVLITGAGLAPKRLVGRLISGSLLVTTPHQAGGAYSERGAGGIYPVVKASAKFRTLEAQLKDDPRIDSKGGAEWWNALVQTYAN